MTDDEQYETQKQEINYAFGERKSINKKFLSVCERKIDATPTSENPTKWIIGKLAFQEFEDIWNNFEILSMAMINAIQNLEHRIHALEDTAIKMGAKINPEEIASVSKFAEEFSKHIEEVKKKNAEYKRKMEENDLAT